MPATDDDVAEAVSFLVTALEPQAASGRAVFLARICRTRDWTRAEWMEVMREAPFKNHYGQGLKLDVLADIVEASRRRRRNLTRMISEAERDEIVAASGGELSVDDFGCWGYDEKQRKIYRYVVRNPDGSGRLLNP